MKIPIIYGIVSGFMISLWILAGYYFRWYALGFASYWLLSSYLIQIVTLFLGIKAFKDKKYEGEISYINALWGGLIITFFLTTIYSVTTFIYFSNSGNEILDYAITESTKALTELKKPLSEINETKIKITDALTPSNQLKSAFIEKFIIGLFFSLVFATILRKRNPELK
jgi:hypothetical protein